MILARFLYNNRVEWGIVDGDDVLSVQGSIFSGPSRETGCARSQR